MSYMCWFDDNRKKPVERKIAEGAQAYYERFQTRPKVVMVNEADRCECKELLMMVPGYVQPNNFWFGERG